MNASDEDPAIAVELLEVFLRDREIGKRRPVADYLALFPGYESQVARQLAQLEREAGLGGDPPASAAAERARSEAVSPGVGWDLYGPEGSRGRASTEPLSQNLIVQLRSRGPSYARYEDRGEVARGGMGVIRHVYDKDVRRDLAMKVIRLPCGVDADVRESDAENGILGRFLEEAQITGQLDHPGIVPLHELGVDGHGQVYFTMKLVKGETFSEVIKKVESGEDEWHLTRAVHALLRACEAMAYAHDKGVVHRDLKPSNIMVGRFGESYVMDWGIARVLGQEDKKDIRIRSETVTSIGSVRKDAREETPDSPLVTRDGDVIGTPTYMSPEQAKGAIDEVGPASDVYSMGAILYHLLTGRMPYVKPGELMSPRTILHVVLQGPPTPAHQLAKNVPAELVAICETAMSREIADRYHDMTELANDLRAYLENRAVSRMPTGALGELRLWAKRNPQLAWTVGIAGALLVAACAVAVGGWRKASDQEAKAAANADVATTRKAEFDQLAGVVYLKEAKAKEQELYPAWPDKIEAMERWQRDDAGWLKEIKPKLDQTIAVLEARALLWSDADRQADRNTQPRFGELEPLQKKVASLRRAQSIREGQEAAEAAAIPDEMAGKTADELNREAWPLVNPDESKRTYGLEALGLSLARAAVAKANAGDESVSKANLLNTLAWALFANGLDADALETFRQADALTTEEAKGNYGKRYEKLAVGEAASTLATAEDALSTLEADLSRRRTWRFAQESERFLHGTLAALSADITAFESNEIKGVEERLDWARRIGELTLDHPRARVTWEEARHAIAQADGVVASELYREHPIDLKPQMGLVPIGMNPQTKLWEFYELRTAWNPTSGKDPAEIETPSHREDGTIDVRDDTGIVFVLIPGGTFWQGAQSKDKDGRNYEAQTRDDEGPQAVTLAPFFLARYELTKGQWMRLTNGANPSWYRLGQIYQPDERPIDWTYPVEEVSWMECETWLARFGLSLPTEAQWEYGARGGTTTPRWTGDYSATCSDAINARGTSPDTLSALSNGARSRHRDEFAWLAPVGSLRANAFGLHDVYGNVIEWCADTYGPKYGIPRQGDGLREPDAGAADLHVNRGGSLHGAVQLMRSAARGKNLPDFRNDDLGVRAARRLIAGIRR